MTPKHLYYKSTGSDLSEPPLSSTPADTNNTSVECRLCCITSRQSVTPPVSPCSVFSVARYISIITENCSQYWYQLHRDPDPRRYSGKLHKFNEDPLLKDSISRIVSTGKYRTRDLSQLTHDSALGRVRVSSLLEMTHPHLSRYSLPPVTEI